MAVKNKVTEVSVKKKLQKIVIEEYYDGFAIIVGDERFHFDQADSYDGLAAVFTAAGFDDVSFEAVY